MESQTYQAQLAIAKAELERTSAQRQRFMAVVAHELRNFVQGLSYAAQLWEKQPDNKRALLFAQTQIRDMQELLHLLLEHSTLVGARQPPSLQPFDLQALCEELAVITSRLQPRRGYICVTNAKRHRSSCSAIECESSRSSRTCFPMRSSTPRAAK
jgi:signal transduction histidine kinase